MKTSPAGQLNAASASLYRVFPIVLRTNGWTDRPKDGLMDRFTDTPSYRDARTHLKTMLRQREYIALTHWTHLFPSVALVKLGQFFKKG